MIYLRCAFIIAYLTVLCLYFFSETSGNFKRRAVNKIALAVLFEGYAVGAYLLHSPLFSMRMILPIGLFFAFLSMQVHHQFLWLCIGLGGFGLALRGFLFLGRSCAQQGFLDLLSIGKGSSYGLVVPHYAYCPAGISEEFIGLERM